MALAAFTRNDVAEHKTVHTRPEKATPYAGARARGTKVTDSRYVVRLVKNTEA